jgi:hypothetical protein
MGMDGSPERAEISPNRQDLFLYFKDGREGMAFPAADVWIKTGAPSLFTKSADLDTPLEGCPKGTGDLAAQAHEFAGIGKLNGRHRAGAAEIPPPVCTQQAAFFMVATAIVIAIKILAFRAGWSPHITLVPHVGGRFGFYTRVI